MDFLDTIRINRQLAKKIGIKEAIIYSILAEVHFVTKTNGELDNGEWFPCRAMELESKSTLNKEPVARCVKRLEELNLIETSRSIGGIKQPRHFRLTNEIHKFMAGNK